MFGKLLTAGIAAMLLSTAVNAETYEVLMLNKGESGSMVFEPAFIAAEPGDTVTFIPTTKGHNVESVDGMLPAGVEEFKSKMSKEFSITVTEEGLYGIKCTPHYSMGMVALIQVGAATNLDDVTSVKLKGKVAKRFALLFDQVK